MFSLCLCGFCLGTNVPKSCVLGRDESARSASGLNGWDCSYWCSSTPHPHTNRKSSRRWMDGRTDGWMVTLVAVRTVMCCYRPGLTCASSKSMLAISMDFPSPVCFVCFCKFIWGVRASAWPFRIWTLSNTSQMDGWSTWSGAKLDGWSRWDGRQHHTDEAPVPSWVNYIWETQAHFKMLWMEVNDDKLSLKWGMSKGCVVLCQRHLLRMRLRWQQGRQTEENWPHLPLICCLIETDNTSKMPRQKKKAAFESSASHSVAALAPSALWGTISVFISTLITSWHSSPIKAWL